MTDQKLVGTNVTLIAASPSKGSNKSGKVSDLVSSSGDMPNQPRNGLSLSNAPAVVVVRLQGKHSKTGSKTRSKKAKKSKTEKYVWGIVSQSVADTVLLPMGVRVQSHQAALDEAQAFVQDAVHTSEDEESRRVVILVPMSEQPDQDLALSSGQDLALEHELAGLRTDALVSLASYPEAKTHHSGNVLHFSKAGVKSEFWYAVQPERQALLSLRVRAYALLPKK